MKKIQIFILILIFSFTLVGCNLFEDSKFEGIVEEQYNIDCLFYQDFRSEVDFCYLYYLSKTQNKDFIELMYETFTYKTTLIKDTYTFGFKVLRNGEIVKITNYNELLEEEIEKLIPIENIEERYFKIGERTEQAIVEAYESAKLNNDSFEKYLDEKRNDYLFKYYIRNIYTTNYSYYDNEEQTIKKWYDWIISQRNKISPEYHQTLMEAYSSDVEMDYNYSIQMFYTLGGCNPFINLHNNIDMFIVYYEVVINNSTFLDVMCNSKERKIHIIRDSKLCAVYASELTEKEKEKVLEEEKFYTLYNDVKEKYFKLFINDITELYVYYKTGNHDDYFKSILEEDYKYFELSEENVTKWYNIIQNNSEVWNVNEK